MNIVFNSDDNYAPYLSTVLLSIIKQHLETPVHFWILELNMAEESQKYLTQLCAQYNKEITFIHIKEDDFSDLPLTVKYISPVTYARLFMAQYLPQDLDKVLYLDIDLMVNQPLTDFYQTDLTHYVLAAVPDVLLSGLQADYKATLGLTEKDIYFNAGVLLINLKAYRKYNMRAEILQMLKNCPEFSYQDQDMLNYIFKGQVLFCDLRYNFQSALRQNFSKFKQLQSLLGHVNCTMPVAIFHDTGRVKAWNVKSSNISSVLFSQYLSLLTPPYLKVGKVK